MKYELILLDADGTLFDFDRAAEVAFAAVCAEYGIAGSVREELELSGSSSVQRLFPRYLEINHQCWTALERGELDKEVLKVERFRRLFAESDIGVDPAPVAARYLELLAKQAQLLPGAEAFVRRLSEAEVQLAIVTNGISQVQRGRFYDSPFAALIPTLLISEELGAEKPSRDFFVQAFRHLGRPENDLEGVVVLGDSWSADILGALGFGLDAVWYNPKKKTRPTSEPPTDDAARVIEVSTYEEALAFFGIAPGK